MTIEQLNDEFGIAEQLTIIEGKGGRPLIKVANDHANALISLYAGQVLSFTPKGAEDLLFLSEKAYFVEGKAIKGGIPICWPWFGPDPAGTGRPAHGFARISWWTLLATSNTNGTSNNSTTVKLGLQSNADTRALWPYEFDLTLVITVGKALKLELTTHNTGAEAFSITQALHSYFAVGDISQTSVSGLEGKSFIDKTNNDAIEQQQGKVTIDSEVDRIYQGVPGSLTIQDDAKRRNIQIASSGNNTAVVWNPWKDISSNSADLQDNDYQRFICVENVNAVDDVIEVPAGGQFSLVAELSSSR